jgi:hypothetical protein
MQTLIDTGAGLSFVNSQFASHNELCIQPPKEVVHVVVASGEMIQSRGFVKATVSIGDFQLPITLQVLEDSPVNLILGIDFLTQSKATIDFNTHTHTQFEFWMA